jgi:hypothetical protein
LDRWRKEGKEKEGKFRGAKRRRVKESPRSVSR